MCHGFQWTMQQQDFSTNVYLLPLESYDLILGIQWLKTLGIITWNFTELTMNFELLGKLYLFQVDQFGHGQALNVINIKELDGFQCKEGVKSLNDEVLNQHEWLH